MKIEGTQVLTLHKYVQPICEIVSNLHSHMVYHILQLVKRQSLGYALKKVRISQRGELLSEVLCLTIHILI